MARRNRGGNRVPSAWSQWIFIAVISLLISLKRISKTNEVLNNWTKNYVDDEPDAQLPSQALSVLLEDGFELRNKEEESVEEMKISRNPVNHSESTSIESIHSNETKTAQPVSGDTVKIPQLYPLSKASQIVQPIWKCGERLNHSKKFVFVHIFKTAGSTLRYLFHLYAKHCRTGWALVVGCSGLSVQSMEYGHWAKANGSRCKFKKSVTFSGDEIKPSYPYINTTYIRDNVDLFGGHLPLGAGESFRKEDGTPESIRYFMIFRNPVEKFISGNLFKHRNNHNITFDILVQEMKSLVNDARAKGKYYNGYRAYCLTPFQEKYKLGKMDVISTTELMMQNLIDYNVILGMVDQMPQSLEILHHELDSDGKTKRLFLHFGMKDSNGNIKRPQILNKSVFSTSEFIAELKKDQEFYPNLVEYVKYDQMLVDFARKLYLLQYNAIKSSFGYSDVLSY